MARIDDPPATEPAPATEPPAPLHETRGARWRRRLKAVARDLALLLIVLAAVQFWRARDLVARGEPAPELDLFDLDGRRHQLSELQGKTVLVHFWATWCGVCRREFDALEAVERSLGPNQVLLTVVEDGDDLEHVTNFVAERGLDYPILLAENETTETWRIDVFPTNYYIDADGNVAMRQTGLATRWGMRARLFLAGL